MKIKHLVACCFFLILISCNDEKKIKQTQPIEEISPETLTETKSSGFSFSKRSYKESLISQLFNEASQKNESLRLLVGQIRKVQSAKSDSTKVMENFIRNNDEFYDEIEDYLGYNISDTTLRAETLMLFKKAQTSFHNKIEREKELLTSVSAKSNLLEQQLDLMRLYIAHSMMLNYQNNSLPDTKPLEDIIQQYDVLIQETEAYVK